MPKDLKKMFEDEPDTKLKNLVTKFYTFLMKERKLKGDLEDAKELKGKAELELYQALQNAGLELLRTSEGTFYQKLDMYASFTEGNKEKGLDWLKELDYGDMIYETINANSFSALIRQFKKDKMIEIPDFVGISQKERVGYRKK